MPSQKQALERKDNISAIVAHLRTAGKKSRRELCDELRLSWGCISELSLLLLQQNILVEEPAPTPTKGRSPGLLTLNPCILYLGILVEKTGLKASVCNLPGHELAAYNEPLDYSSKEALVACVSAFTQKVLDAHPQIQGIGFAMQGICHQAEGTWEFPSRPHIYLNIEDLQSLFTLPSIVEHDTNCVLYSSLTNTRQRKMILHLSQGIGAALYTGTGFSKSDLMEFGYLVVDPQGTTMQQVASLDALRRHCGKADPAEARADAFFADMGNYLGTALANFCNLIHLDEILLCGDMVRHFDRFRPTLTETYHKSVLSASRATITPISQSNAAYGAARMAMDTLLQA